jgi:hypothetical protein
VHRSPGGLNILGEAASVQQINHMLSRLPPRAGPRSATFPQCRRISVCTPNAHIFSLNSCNFLHLPNLQKECDPADFSGRSLSPNRDLDTRYLTPENENSSATHTHQQNNFKKSGRNSSPESRHPKTTFPPQPHHNSPASHREFSTENRKTPLKNGIFTTRKKTYKIYRERS